MFCRVPQIDKNDNDQLDGIDINIYVNSGATARFHLRDCFAGLLPGEHSLPS